MADIRPSTLETISNMNLCWELGRWIYVVAYRCINTKTMNANEDNRMNPGSSSNHPIWKCHSLSGSSGWVTVPLLWVIHVIKNVVTSTQAHISLLPWSKKMQLHDKKVSPRPWLTHSGFFFIVYFNQSVNSVWIRAVGPYIFYIPKCTKHIKQGDCLVTVVSRDGRI